MVAGCVAALTRGSAVSQCADTTRIASGRGRLRASSAQARVSLPSSTASVGAPWERKTTGSRLLPVERHGEIQEQQWAPHLQAAADPLVVAHLEDFDRLALLEVDEPRIFRWLDGLGRDRHEFLPRGQGGAEAPADAVALRAA